MLQGQVVEVWHYQVLVVEVFDLLVDLQVEDHV